VEQEINSMRARVLVVVGCESFDWQHAHQEQSAWSYLWNEHCYNRSSNEKIIKMQGVILKIWALGRSSMQRKQTWGQTFPLL
jgi:hypothetical protein